MIPYALVAMAVSAAIACFCGLSLNLPFLVSELPTLLDRRWKFNGAVLLMVLVAIAAFFGLFASIAWGRTELLGAALPTAAESDAFWGPVAVCSMVVFVVLITACMAFVEYFSVLKNTRKVRAGRGVERIIATPLALIAGACCLLMFVLGAR